MGNIQKFNNWTNRIEKNFLNTSFPLHCFNNINNITSKKKKLNNNSVYWSSQKLVFEGKDEMGMFLDSICRIYVFFISNAKGLGSKTIKN